MNTKTEERVSVPFMPNIDTPEKAEKLDSLISERGQADYACYMILRRIVNNCFDRDLADIEDAREVVAERERINDEIMRLISGI